MSNCQPRSPRSTSVTFRPDGVESLYRASRRRRSAWTCHSASTSPREYHTVPPGFDRATTGIVALHRPLRDVEQPRDVPDREWQIALEPFHGLMQLGVDRIRDGALRLQHALQNVDQFRELVFHDVLEIWTPVGELEYAMFCLNGNSRDLVEPEPRAGLCK